ncbi:peptidoglycan-binding protein LysM [Elioraea rosea]|uniref:peptidoglycan-binding protein LysM n=1 Tax=Elioraea rosea TaxID=2492390 RepID=UPI001185E2DD|nr:peptidoglycan-binding protein LysM [Elioraea rosea]
MGLFSFVKAAGRLLGIGKAEAAVQDESKPAPAPPTAEAIRAELDRLGLPPDVKVTVEGDTVKLTGGVADPATRERAILAAGNVAGIAAVEETIAAVEEMPAPVFHTVAKGDTLWKIAEKHLGSGAKYPVIFEANKPMLTHPDMIYPGQVLRIPKQG